MKLAGISEALLIPLAYRDDVVARRFRDQLDCDWQALATDSARAATITRTQILDDIVGAFVREHRGGLVVNLGAGLDTRFHRLDDGAVQWLDVDLPAVIAVRAQLGEPVNPRHALFAGSIFEPAWIAAAHRSSALAIMLVAEGILPYFSEAQHRAIFAMLAESFPGEEIAFETTGGSPAELRSAVEALDPRVRFVEQRSVGGAGAKIVHARFV